MMLTPIDEVDGILLVDAAAMWGRQINLFAKDLSMLARMSGKRVLAEFNQHTLDVTPGMSAAAIYDQWLQMQLKFERS